MTLLAWLGCVALVVVVLFGDACLDPDRRAARRERRRLQPRKTRRIAGGYQAAQSVGIGYRPIASKKSAIAPPPGSCGIPRKPWINESDVKNALTYTPKPAPETAAVLLARARKTNAQLAARRRRRRHPPAPNPTRPYTRKDG